MVERNSNHNLYLKETLKLDTFCDFICWKSTAYSCMKNLLTSVTVTTGIILGSVKHVFVGLFTCYCDPGQIWWDISEINYNSLKTTSDIYFLILVDMQEK